MYPDEHSWYSPANVIIHILKRSQCVYNATWEWRSESRVVTQTKNWNRSGEEKRNTVEDVPPLEEVETKENNDEQNQNEVPQSETYGAEAKFVKKWLWTIW